MGEDRKKISKATEAIMVEVSDQIKQALHPPSLPSALRRWLKEWGTTGALITGAISLLGLTLTAAYFAIAESSRNSEFRGATTEHLKDVDASLKEIRAQLAAMNPKNQANQQSARRIISAARKPNAAPLSSSVVEQVGQSFIQAADSDNGAWDVALDFASYKSTLNAGQLPQPFTTIPGSFETDYFVPRPDGKTVGQMTWIGPIVSKDDAARIDLIGTDRNKDRPTGPSWLRLLGGTASLDDVDARKVVFEGVEIHYSGQPVILDNVLFINCRFVLDNNASGRKLGERLLSDGRISFTG